MPTLQQLAEWTKAKMAKYGPNGHCSQPICSEEARKEAIENKPDAKGRQKTRIALETYSPRAYQDWNAMLETLMERCHCNPLVVVDLLRLLVMEAQRERMVLNGKSTDGITIALYGLHKVADYEQELREAKELRRKQRSGKAWD